jgi:hypothetical protein
MARAVNALPAPPASKIIRTATPRVRAATMASAIGLLVK